MAKLKTPAPPPPDTLPAIATPEQVAEWLETTTAALAQDRYLGRGLPYVKIGGRVRYMSDDVKQYLEENRRGPAATSD